jgi:NitT/TauT family transport system ATP-binding protein
MTSKIQVRGVTREFDVRPTGKDKRSTQVFTALQDINLDVRAGEFVVVVGPSGCGKSTLLDLLAGLTSPSAGEILIDGKPVNGPGLDRAIVFQQYALFPWRTARANVEFGLEAQGTSHSSRSERRAKAQQYLSLVGLDGFEGRYPHELSGGMKQRVAIARSLAYEPDVLLLDEPFAALDAQTRESLQDELLRIWRHTGKTIVFITHGIDEAVYLGQRVVVMTSRPGRIRAVIDIPDFDASPDEDVRSRAEFVQYRHEIWKLMREEHLESTPLGTRGGDVAPISAIADRGDEWSSEEDDLVRAQR